MTRKQQRLLFLVFSMVFVAMALVLALLAFRDNIVFFFTPTELAAKHIPAGRPVRVGGLVKEGSVERSRDGASLTFALTDHQQAVIVEYRGLPPNLFREGQGVVAEGALTTDGRFAATSIMAKHDETYMPKEVADALKKSGYWRHDGKPVTP